MTNTSAIRPYLAESIGGWEKHKANPVLGPDSGVCGDICVYRAGGLYRVWLSNPDSGSIALTESWDGVRWSAPEVVLTPDPDDPSEMSVSCPVVLKRGGYLWMWYAARTDERCSIGCARSEDGRRWVRLSREPALAADQPWEKTGVMWPHVLYDAAAGLFKMWYSGGDRLAPTAIGYAVSKNGLRWTKRPANPIFRPDRENPWERSRVAGCQVIREGDWYVMFYTGYRDESLSQIGLARSRDGITGWQRHPANPIVRPGAELDDACCDRDGAALPRAVLGRGRWTLWYIGRSGAERRIGLAGHRERELFPEVPVPPGQGIKPDLMELRNAHIRVALMGDRPVVREYEYLPTGETFVGSDGNGRLVLNGKTVAWNRWHVTVRRDGVRNQIVYQMYLPGCRLNFDITYLLRDNVLSIRVDNVQDPEVALTTLAWKDLPLLTCSDPRYRFWRVEARQRSWDRAQGEDRGDWSMEETSGQVGEAAAERRPLPVVHGCLFRPDRLAAFVSSSFPLLPVTHQALHGGRYAIGLNTFHHRVRSRTFSDFEAQVVFLRDENGDGESDLNDYRLWMGRRQPEADSIYRDGIWYRLLCDSSAAGAVTSFDQARQIVAAIHNVTDGLPQIPCLVGWQHRGAGVGQHSMDRVNPRLGGESGLRALGVECRVRLHAELSFDVSIDGAERQRGNFDEAIMALSPDGFEIERPTPGTARYAPGPRAEHECEHFRVSHTKYVESGHLFDRLAALLRILPAPRAIHLDGMRITNCNPDWEPERIGLIEELLCGAMPALDFLRSRGVSVTIGGRNGAPIDWTGLVSGFRRNDLPDGLLQMVHGKLFDGDSVASAGRRDPATGASADQLISFDPASGTLSYSADWPAIVDRIYLHTLLSHFLVEREMTHYEPVSGGVRIRYADNVVVERVDDRLMATWRDLLIADGCDRFIPRGDAIYAYSLAGSERLWTLPPRFRRQRPDVFALSKAGRALAPEYRVERERIWLRLPPRTPVKIALRQPI